MKNWSIKKILLINAVLGISLISLLGATSLIGSNSINGAVIKIESIFDVIKTQMHSNRMHESVRSDVLEAISTVQRGEYSQLAAIESATKDHTRMLVADLQRIATAEQDKNPTIAQHAQSVIAMAERFSKIAITMVSTVGSNPDLVADSLPAFNEISDTLQAELQSLTSEISAQTSQARESAHGIFIQTALATGVLWAVAATISALLSWVLLKNVLKPLNSTVETITEIEESGNLTLRVKATGKNEMGRLVHAINSLMKSQHKIVQDVRLAAIRLTENSSALAEAANLSLASSESSNDTASSVAAAVEELSVSISHMSDQAQDAHHASNESQTLSLNSEKLIKQTSDEMRSISASVHQSSSTIRELAESVSKISSMAKVINEIAEQTNLLALNAAIEAARAGELGRGFAVVADEVRNLAERTSESTKQIAHTIDTIQSGTKLAVQSMEEGVKRVELGESLSEQARQAMEELALDAARAAQAVSQITASLMEQKAVGHDIGKAVEKVAAGAEHGRSIASDTAGRAKDLTELASQLTGQVNRFRT